MSNRMLRTSLQCEVRSINEDTREATFVASTERAVSVGPWEPEVLRMKGARLGRYLKNPVLLDSHNRWNLDAVIGSCKVAVDGRELVATARYAKTDAGNRAWELVKDGHVRAMSIGYSVNPKKVTRLKDGETDGEGDGLVRGPASIANDWELLEISNVPVPADEDAVRRSFYSTIKGRRTSVSKPRSKSIDFTRLAAIAALDTLATRDAKDGDGDMDASSESEAKAEDAEVVCPHCNKSFVPERAEDDGDAESDAEPEKKGAEATSTKSLTLLPMERKARELEATKRALAAITPTGLEQIASRGLAEGLPFAEIQKRLLAEQSKRFAPLGTLEPAPIERENPNADESERAIAELDDDTLVRSLESL
jgi:hypothetical protein